MGAHWTDIPELVDREVASIRARVDQAQPGNWYVDPATETWRAPGTVRTQYDGYNRTVGVFTNVLPADLDLVLHAHSDLQWCLEMIDKLRARVADLESERAVTNAALSQAVEDCAALTKRVAELEAAEAGPRVTFMPKRDALCLCGHTGLDHHHAGEKCWAHLPKAYGDPIAICPCAGFVAAEAGDRS
jgi:hypothetical protein